MKTIHWLLLFGCTVWNISTFAADKPIEMQARDLATDLCAGCHGPSGLSQSDAFPSLAGQKATYLAKQLRDFRDGKRKDPTMNGIASSLTDEQILALAQRFSAGPKR